MSALRGLVIKPAVATQPNTHQCYHQHQAHRQNSLEYQNPLCIFKIGN